jgi:hypothetical protein
MSRGEQPLEPLLEGKWKTISKIMGLALDLRPH